jgi:tryptophan synthase alpha chain
MDAEAIDTVFLISPTTSDARLAQVVTLGRGYLYYVSLKGVTGAANIDVADVAQRLTHIRQFTSLPLGVGFGIRDGETAGRIAKIADAVVIGSRLVQDLERAPLNAVDSANALMTEIRVAMDQQVLK